jgi:hypothetical protein
MARKTDSPNKRMRLLEYKSRQLQPHESVFSLLKKDPSSSPELLKYAWEKEAHRALQIQRLTYELLPESIKQEAPPDWSDPAADSMQRAFEMFKLDPDDPWSWNMLARYISMIFFWKPPSGKKGRPKKWTPKLLMELEQQAAKFEALPNTKAAKRLANDKLSPFLSRGVDSKSGVEGLRKKIGAVRRKPQAKTMGRNR